LAHQAVSAPGNPRGLHWGSNDEKASKTTLALIQQGFGAMKK
jgi:hypothetical protein